MLRINLKHKRGDGLSINIIVIAVIALLILVILAFMVLKGTGTFSKGVNACGDGCVFDKGECKTGWVAVPSSCTTVGGQTGNFCCTNVDGATN